MHWIAPSEKHAAVETLEKRLWSAAHLLRANSGLKAQEYSCPILGIIFLRFTAERTELEEASASPARRGPGVGGSRRGSRVDEPVAYHADCILYLAPNAHFDHLLNLPEAADIGAKVNEAMRQIEKHNPQLAGVLPKAYYLFTIILLKEPPKKVSKTGSSTFSGEALVGVPSLAIALKWQSRAFDICLATQVSTATQAALADSPSQGRHAVRLQRALLRDRSQLFQTALIYEEHRFAKIALRPKTQALSSQNHKEGDLHRLNRLLIEDAYPPELSRNRAARTHVANEHFNPDLLIKVRDAHNILVVVVKADDDDANWNKAKCRDGLKHFETLNQRLAEVREPWRYHFYFLSPEDYTKFFEQVRNKTFATWRSSLMQELMAA